MDHNEEGIKEVKKRSLVALLFVNPTLFVSTTTRCIPLKAQFFFISFNLNVIRSQAFISLLL
jgi:hypothetical protein